MTGYVAARAPSDKPGMSAALLGLAQHYFCSKLPASLHSEVG